MIWKKTGLMALAVCAVGFTAVPRASAGTEMVEPEYAPAPRANYTPPVPVYYVPPPVVRIVVYPRYAYYGPRFHAYGYQRVYGRRGYHGRSHHGR
ncbi:MAG: hypothetical protein ABI946_01470 [Chthoniobacterales bacterium]